MQSSTPAPCVSKQRGNVLRPCARGFSLLHSHVQQTSTLVRNPSPPVCSVLSIPCWNDCSDLFSASIWEVAPCCRLPGIAFKIFRFSAQITSVIQIKAEGNEEALVSGIPWISLQQSRAEPGPSSVVISTAMPGLQSDNGSFIATSEPYGVLCEPNKEQKTAPMVTLDWTPANRAGTAASQLWHALPQYFCCSHSA